MRPATPPPEVPTDEVPVSVVVGARLDSWDDHSVTIDGRCHATGNERIMLVGAEVLVFVPAAPHGYAGYKRGCRCPVCQAANTGYMAGYRAGLAKGSGS